MMPRIAALILTLNEEVNIRDCIRSVSFADQVFVFDSISFDKTTEIAEMEGAIVSRRKFDNYAAQRNAALESIPIHFDWILMLDADERITPELQKEILNVLSTEGNKKTLYRIKRKDFFFGTWYKHTSGYPNWFPRLFKNKHVTVLREINEEYATDGEIGHLKEHLLHFPFNKGIAYWFERHNVYSTMEAKTIASEITKPIHFKDFFSTDPLIKRKFLKQLAFRIPGRPFLVYVYLLVFRLGFLDGQAGFHYARMRSIYEYMIDLKIKELKLKQSGHSI